MKNILRPMLALSLAVALGAGECANAGDAIVTSGYGNISYGSQLAYDSFNYTVRKRLESVRIGSLGTPFSGSRQSAPDDYVAPPGGYGAAPGYTPGYGAAPGYVPPGQSYGGGYNPGMTPGYTPPGYTPAPSFDNAPSGYNSGYNPGFGPGQGYGPNTYNGAGTINTGYPNQGFGGTNGYSYAISSDSAYAMAPSSRASSVASARRRQLDCVYYSGFTVWADLYQTWARQRARGGEDGYRYRVFGPAVGFDWTSGPLTLGAAMTYGWGKLKGRDYSHEQKMQTWGLELYGQYNSDNFYINGTLGYGHNSIRSRRPDWDVGTMGDRIKSNAVNIDAEFGWKMNWSGFQVIPTAGLRFFHDRRGSINEGNGNNAVRAGVRNYHVLELPVGVNFLYEINTGGMVFVPRARLAWIPELSRRRGAWDGTYNGPASVNASERAKNGFQVGLGMEAKLTRSLSAHVDYNCNFRSREYEHHWNLGMGFTF